MSAALEYVMAAMATPNIEEQADYWLNEWAQWARRDVGLGYPRRSIVDKFKEGGIASGSKPPTIMPDEVAKTDAAVGLLRLREDSILLRAIQIRYLERAPIDSLARRFHMRRQKAYTLLARAQRAIWSLRA